MLRDSFSGGVNVQMKFSSGLSAVLMGSALMAGCATITRGTTQVVAVDTPGVAGANCTLASSSFGSREVVTPATVTLDKGQSNVQVTCRKQCYQDAAGLIPSYTDSMTAGNILVGGVVGLGVDAATGAMNKYNDNNQFTMIPIPGCRPSA